MNIFSYYITTYFITINKYYNSCRNLLSMYQTYPNGNVITNNMKEKIKILKRFKWKQSLNNKSAPTLYLHYAFSLTLGYIDILCATSLK